MTEMQFAKECAEALSVHGPRSSDFKVAIFVFRYDEPRAQVTTAYLSGAPLVQLRQWIRLWLNGTKSTKKEAVH
jgi:hypothetical protein